MALKFQNLPLIEVAARYTLSDKLPIDLSFLVDIYDLLGEDFPEIEEPNRFEAPPGVQNYQLDLSTFYGCKFSNPAIGLTLIIQKDLIGVRWLSSDPTEPASGDNAYPGFEECLLPCLDRLERDLNGMLGDGSVKACVANMFYTNFIKADLPLDGKVLADYIKDVAWRHCDEPSFLYEVTQNWRQKNNTDLRLTIKGAEGSVGGNSSSGYLLTTSAGHRVEDPKASRGALLSVHSSLGSLFERIITEHASKQWKKV